MKNDKTSNITLNHILIDTSLNQIQKEIKNTSKASITVNNNNKEAQIDFISEIKNYLKNSNNTENYQITINEEPEKLFETITIERIILWQTILYNNGSPTIINSDNDILNVSLNQKEQNIILNDAIRTRSRENKLIPNFKNILESMITFYCQTKNIIYKQGLSEIFGPLILMKYKIKCLKYTSIFNLGEVFIDKFLPNYYYEKDLYSLRGSLSLLTILLRYHEPSVYNRLYKIEILPEMFATSWLITLMSGKVNLDILYDLWDHIIQINDPLFIHFISVALIKNKRELFINCDTNLVGSLMSSLTIKNKEELEILIQMALQLRAKTPYSFRILAHKLGFFIPNNPEIKEKFEIYKPENIPAMPIFPTEIFYNTNKNLIKCPDYECRINNKNCDKYDNLNNNHICEKCDMKIYKNLDYAFLDIRIFQYDTQAEMEKNYKLGYLPKMINVEQMDLKSEDIEIKLTQKYISERGDFHFIFVVSNTESFNDFEKQYYEENISEIVRKKMLFGVIQQKRIDKELNLPDAEKNLNIQQIYKLKEYDNFKKILKSMQDKNYPYIGYVFGGFENIHNESIKFNIPLISHDPSICEICLKNLENSEENHKKKRNSIKVINEFEEDNKNVISNELWEHAKKLKINDMNKFFDNKKNFTQICSLLGYKGKIFKEETVYIFLVISQEKYDLEFYKFEKKFKMDFKYIYKKENKDILNIKNDSNYYNLGIDNNENDNKNKFELTLLDEINIRDVEKISIEKEHRQIMTVFFKDIKKFEFSKDKADNHKDKSYFDMKIDFFTVEDAKRFMKFFKNIQRTYKTAKINRK